MSEIVINDINPQVIEQLEIIANQNNRTLSEEIKVILEQATASQTYNLIPNRKHYPLRGKPIIIADDFDESMPELWDALAE